MVNIQLYLVSIKVGENMVELTSIPTAVAPDGKAGWLTSCGQRPKQYTDYTQFNQ